MGGTESESHDFSVMWSRDAANDMQHFAIALMTATHPCFDTTAGFDFTNSIQQTPTSSFATVKQRFGGF